MLLILFSISLCFSRVSPDTGSFTVLYTRTSGMTNGPEFVGVAMLNGVPLSYYDSDTLKMASRQQFITDYLNADNWDYLNLLGKKRYDVMNEILNMSMISMNLTTGIHTLQWIRTLEVSEDGSVKRLMRFGFDGKDFINLEPDRMKWMASNHFARMTKVKWDSDESWNNYWKWQLETELFDLLNKYLRVGKEYFERKDIEVTWLRNGEVMSGTHSLGVRPNHDGTHQIQKEIGINAGDEDQYSCQIEHSSLAEAQLYQWVPFAGPSVFNCSLISYGVN
ncbi:class I histocompatibility antigen, F10 alpha chain-like isoform X3 [Chiloscyllium punctatum]|uniref:class I histocompatibility antigen, F10 alpha chain-like isoform X3 n=1 Tax=Chiloscyllium punctatum TaxID=137246 RepID=UPI003B6324EE